MVYKHTYLNTLLLLHSAFMLSVVKMPLKKAVGGRALKSHGNYIVDHGNSWKDHGIVFLNFCGNPGDDLLNNTIISSSSSLAEMSMSWAWHFGIVTAWDNTHR